MPLTAESEAVLNVLAEQGVKALDELPAADGRAYFNEVFKTKPEDQEPVARIQELSVPVDDGEIPARLYVPEGGPGLPLMVHYHGGGWVYLNLDTHDAYCRQLANRAGCAVLAVEYRKAPEHPFPTPVEDCYRALCWAASNAEDLGVDGKRVGVVGDSAGGNLASGSSTSNDSTTRCASAFDSAFAPPPLPSAVPPADDASEKGRSAGDVREDWADDARLPPV